MKNRTVTITVAASYEEVYGFLSDPRTLPEWAESFSSSIEERDRSWFVVTPQGIELSFAIEADRVSGCIEMMAGPTFEQMESFPIRVFKADSGETAVSFTMFKSRRPGFTDQQFDAQFRVLVKEVGALMDRFGGGELCSDLPELVKVYPGLLTNDLAASRDFYLQHFGFELVFDGPWYVHLTRSSGGEQIGLMAICEDAPHPELERTSGGNGLWLSIEVDDVDAEYERLLAEGLDFREGPMDQPWGERTCVLVGPDGVLIYLSHSTGKMDESLQQYVVKGSMLVGS